MRIEDAIERIARRKREAAQLLQPVDVSIWLGTAQQFPLAKELDVSLLGGILSRYAMKGALISHWDGLTLSAQEGNRSLQDVKEKLPEHVYTIWTGLPLVPREQDPLPGFSKPDSHMRGVRLFPKSHHYSLTPWVVGGLCRWCIAHGLPLFLWHVEIEWEAVYHLARHFPKLKIIIESQWQKILYHNRNLCSLMKTSGNVFLETSNFVGQDFITHGVKTFGAEHLLFGSFLPVNDPWTSLGMIIDADISDHEKMLIAGGNMSRILNGAGI
jgi:hypothetical protein